MSYRQGATKLVAELCGNRSRITSVAHRAPARLLPLRVSSVESAGAAWCSVSGYGGGIVGGDQVQHDVRVGEGASLLVTTQAPQKVYRSRNGQAEATSEMDVAVSPGGLFVLAPDPLVAFEGARFRSRQRFNLEPDASAVVVELVGSGRANRGERWSAPVLETRNEFPGMVEAQTLSAPGVGMGGRDAMLTLVTRGPRAALVQERAQAAARELARRKGARVHGEAAIDPPPEFHGDVVAGESEGVFRAAGTRMEDLVRLAQHVLSPLYEQLGVRPYADRLHSSARQGPGTAPTLAQPAPAQVPPLDVARISLSRTQRLALAQLTDATLPTGGFAHSSGLEAASQLGMLDSEDSVAGFVVALLRSLGTQQVPFLRGGYRAVVENDVARWGDLNQQLDTLLCGSALARKASLQTGSGLHRVANQLVSTEHQRRLVKQLRGHLAPVWGGVSATMGIPEEAAVDALRYATARDAVSAAVRLNLVGPLRAVALLRDVLAHPDANTGDIPLECAASSAPLLDALQCAHGALDVRLFHT